MKINALMTMFIALFVALIASGVHAQEWKWTDLRPDPKLVPRIHNVTDEEREERELRKLLIEMLKQERQSYVHEGVGCADDSGGRIQSQKTNDAVSHKAILKKIKDIPWWGWIIVGWVIVELVKSNCK